MNATRYAPLAMLLLGTASGGASATVMQDFDSPGSSYATTLSLDAFASGSRTGPVVVAGGPTGSFLRLIQYPTTFGRYRTGLGFDQTVSGAITRVQAGFDFRITCAGARTGFSGGGCADGFSINFLSTAVSGTSGAVVFNESGVGQTFETAPTPETTATDAFSVGFRTFSTSTPDAGNSLLATYDNAGIQSSFFPTASLDLASGLNGVPGAFHHAELELILGPAPSLTVELTDGTDSSTVLAYDGLDLSGVSGLAPYDMRVNFGARVGDASTIIDLDNISVSFETAQAVPAPGTLALSATALMMLRRRLRREA